MPCCYHKLSPKNDYCNEFFNIPLSKRLKTIMREKFNFINRPFLRLACQQPISRWNYDRSKRMQDGKNMFERAVVECLLDEDETPQKTKKSRNSSTAFCNLTFEEVCSNYSIINVMSKGSKLWNESHKTKFQELRLKYSDGEELSDFLTYLQSKLQVCIYSLICRHKISYFTPNFRHFAKT